jgi:hypothetical protein
MVQGITDTGKPVKVALLGGLKIHKDRIAKATTLGEARRVPWGELLVRCSCGVEFWCRLWHDQQTDQVEPAVVERTAIHPCDPAGDTVTGWRKVTRPLKPDGSSDWPHQVVKSARKPGRDRFGSETNQGGGDHATERRFLPNERSSCRTASTPPRDVKTAEIRHSASAVRSVRRLSA